MMCSPPSSITLTFQPVSSANLLNSSLYTLRAADIRHGLCSVADLLPSEYPCFSFLLLNSGFTQSISVLYSHIGGNGNCLAFLPVHYLCFLLMVLAFKPHVGYPGFSMALRISEFLLSPYYQYWLPEGVTLNYLLYYCIKFRLLVQIDYIVVVLADHLLIGRYNYNV